MTPFPIVTGQDVRRPAKDSAPENISASHRILCDARFVIVVSSMAMEGRMILVTGASGLNGSAVVRECSRNGVAVRALVRDRSKAGALASLPHVELLEGDMARTETLDRALEGIDRALMISSANPQMLETQCRFIDACKAAGVAHVVKFSGKESGIGFDPKKFRFTRMHEEIERYLEDSGLAWTHLRPSQFMQVYLREAPTIAGQGLLLLPLDDVRLSPVDIGDLAQIAFALLTRGGHHGRTFEITGPQALSMGEIATAIGAATGKPVRYQKISLEERRRGMQAAGLPSFMIDALDEQALERLRHPESRVELGTHELFGVKPTTFAEFAKRHAAVFAGGAH
jgi:uncharacterized protein YbjT (DUF2867 family)